MSQISATTYLFLVPWSPVGPPWVPHGSSWMDLWQRSQDTALIWIKSSTEKRRPAYSKKPSLGLGGNSGETRGKLGGNSGEIHGNPAHSWLLLSTLAYFSNKHMINNQHMINTLKAAPNIDFPSNQPVAKTAQKFLVLVASWVSS